MFKFFLYRKNKIKEGQLFFYEILLYVSENILMALPS